MSTEINILVKAVDQASGPINAMVSKINGNMAKVDDASKKVGKSSKEVALAFNNVATSGFALYNAVDRVMDMQVAVDRANLVVKTSLNAVEDAQKRYNAAVDKYGPASEQAVSASKDLQLAQERYTVASERAEMMQGNLNEAMFQSALTVIPSLITMITSVSTLTKGWTTVTQGISGAMSFLAANPIVLVVAGIAALVAGLVWAYQNCEPFRNAVNAIAVALSAVFGPAIEAIRSALVWLWNNVLVPLGEFILGSFVAAWNGVSALWNGVVIPAINAVRDCVVWLWNNVLAPLADFLIRTVLGSWQAMCVGFTAAYSSVLKPIIDAFGTAISWLWNTIFVPAIGGMRAAWEAFCGAFAWFYDTVVKPVVDAIAAAFGWISGILGAGGPSQEEAGGAKERTPGEGAYKPYEPLPGGGPKRGQYGGLITKPTLLLAGEAGPEALLPLDKYNLGPSVRIQISSPLVYVEGSADRQTAEYAADLVEKKLRNVIVEPTSASAFSTHKRIRVGS